jgi:EmrB/QacA subfamily drug resistance transporter
VQQTTRTGIQQGVALALLCIAEFVNVLGVTVVIVALPAIGESLGLADADLQWVASAYALVFGSFLLLAGRAADLYGRRLFFMAGLGMFVGASLICGMADTLPMLVAARAVQGLGAALVLPAALSTLATIFPEGAPRDRAVGIWTAIAAGGGAAGFFLGGVISEALSWRWVFLLNVPMGLLGIVLAPLLLPESRDTRTSRQLDIGGAACVTVGLLLLIYGFTRAEEAGFTLGTLGVFGLALGALLTFFALEARVSHPLVPPRVWRSGDLTGSSLVAFALTATTSAGAVIGTLYLQNVLGYSATATGLAYAPSSVAVVVGSLVGTVLISRVGRKPAMIAGLVLVLLAMLISSQISAAGGFTFLLTGIIVSGLGLGCASVASTATGVSAVAENEGGLASGLLNAAAQVGTAVGIAALTLVAARANASGGEAATALVGGYQLAYLVASGIAACGVLAVFCLVRSAETGGDR